MTPRERLLADLARHDADDAVERGHLEAIRRLVESEEQCFSRSTFVPGHITASAFVVDEDGRLLLHHHRRLDRWLQLGGHDEGEHDTKRTALREAREESGLRDLELALPVILDVDVHPIPGGREPAHLHHDVRYLFRTRSPEAIAKDETESKALAFFSLDEALARLAGPSSIGVSSGSGESDRVIAKIRRVIGAGPR